MAVQETLRSLRSRRLFLKAATAAVGCSVLPFDTSWAQTPARYRRVNVSDPELGPRVLSSYKKAIRAMLDLPPEDPRNWYRNALAHTLDCPHGNWWFLPWHRGYLGWFEQICRELSQDPEFALPYWDWTAEPRIPESMFDDVLDPNHSAFITKVGDFETRFKVAVSKAGYWDNPNGGFDPNSQYGQLLTRFIRFPDDLWFDVIRNPLGSFFFDQPNARGLTKQDRELNADTKGAVALKTLYPSLAARDFTTFASLKSAAHSAATGSGILESQPHNLVHNCIGTRTCNLNDSSGFMYDLMSPVDPIFFLHHANIDRLWDVWTRKQRARGLPALPDGYALKTTLPNDQKTLEERNSDYFRWAKEPFLFFVDARGAAVGKTRAGDYEAIADFNYDYQPASGEDVVPLAPATPPKQLSFAATVLNRKITRSKPGSALVQLPPKVVTGVGVRPGSGLVARITLNIPPMVHRAHWVVVDGPNDVAAVGPDSPFYAGTMAMFGHHLAQGAFTFIVPISGPVSHLRDQKLLTANRAISLRVVPIEAKDHAHDEDSAVEVISIVVESY